MRFSFTLFVASVSRLAWIFVSVPLRFQREGIRYDDLSDEEKKAWYALEWTVLFGGFIDDTLFWPISFNNQKIWSNVKVMRHALSLERLQLHHIQNFFVEAFQHLGGRLKKREEGQ